MGRWPATWPEEAYFIGIGGIAMVSLARVLARRGVRVRGCDAALYPPASLLLADASIDCAVPPDPEHLGRGEPLVVVGNAISRGHPVLECALERGMALASLPEVIERLLIPGRRVSAVAGTHGKTTTAALLSWIHASCGREPGFLVGGLLENFGEGARLGKGEDLILEADEYDSAFFDKGPKFLHYWPQIAILGAVEFDHADIYADLAAVETAFSRLLRLLPASGVLVANGDDPVVRRLAAEARCPVRWFGTDPAADLRAVDRHDHDAGQDFDLYRGPHRLAAVRLPLPGEHNARNALAALLAFEAAGGDLVQGGAALATFLPPRRRLEVLGSKDGARFYDDFAHHPTAVAETLAALRAMGPGRLTVCLEPRSNTMVRRLVQEHLERALALADRVLIAPVDRPERMDPQQRLDVGALAAALRARGIEAVGPLEPEAMAPRVLEGLETGDRIVLMSNGAFGGLADRLRRALESRP